MKGAQRSKASVRVQVKCKWQVCFFFFAIMYSKTSRVCLAGWVVLEFGF